MLEKKRALCARLTLVATRTKKKKKMMLAKRKRDAKPRRADVLFLPGKIIFASVLLLTTGTLLASLSDALLIVSVLFDAAAFVLGVAGIVTLMYLVFYTQGRGHYQLTLWKVADAFFGNILAQSALNLLTWKLARSSSVTVFSNTLPSVSSWYALYDLVLYAALLLTGGGVTDNLALHEATRTIAAVQSAWSAFTVIVIFAAADATLAAHTDER